MGQTPSQLSKKDFCSNHKNQWNNILIPQSPAIMVLPLRKIRNRVIKCLAKSNNIQKTIMLINILIKS